MVYPKISQTYLTPNTLLTCTAISILYQNVSRNTSLRNTAAASCYLFNFSISQGETNWIVGGVPWRASVFWGEYKFCKVNTDWCPMSGEAVGEAPLWSMAVRCIAQWPREPGADPSLPLPQLAASLGTQRQRRWEVWGELLLVPVHQPLSRRLQFRRQWGLGQPYL